MIPESAIREVRERARIVQVVSRHVQLKKSGMNHFGLCPFHPEKTPSFSVHEGKQIFHCFGCHETGNAFDFVMRVEGRTFPEAVRALAREVGVDIPEEQVSPDQARAAREARSERDRVLELNARVADFYRGRLGDAREGARAREYLAGRGIDADTAERFRLGWAPEAWDALAHHLAGARVPPTLAEKAGLILARRSGEGHIDRFRGRVMFPLISPSGEVIGFGGRLLVEREGEGKYINTPETPVYRKGEALYGLHEARRALAQGAVAVLVEGNFDVLALHAAGVRGAVAPMGTALTARQVRLLSRFSDGAVAMFDGDGAGRAAALKSVRAFLEGGLQGKIATLPEGEDPDTLVRGQGAAAVERLLRTAKPAVDHFLSDLLARRQQDRQGRAEGDAIPGRAAALEEAAALLALIEDATERDLYAGRVAADLQIDLARVRVAVRAGGSAEAAQAAVRAAPAVPAAAPPARELLLIGLLCDHPALAARFSERGGPALLAHDGLRRVAAHLCELAAAGDPDWRELIATAPEEIRAAVGRQVFASEFAACEDPARALDEALAEVGGVRLSERAADLRREAARALAAGDEAAHRDLMSQAFDLEKRRRGLAAPPAPDPARAREGAGLLPQDGA